MNTRILTIVVSGITILLLVAGVAGATPVHQLSTPATVDVAVASWISYQGQLTSPSGNALDGTYAMRFVLYDDEVVGSALWDSGVLSISVDDGLFTVPLDVDHSDFDGQALWLSIIVEGETLSPRQEIVPTPYALGLRPGVDIVGDSIGAADAVVAAYAPATGTALYADANGGAGLFGDSEDSYGVWGSSNGSWGGYFTSDGGYGIRVETAGAVHYDHGAWITAEGGYGVYAQSAENQAVRGEAGDTTGITTAFGRVGVVGMGQNRGVHGASNSGLGVYGTSSNSTGVYGNTSRSDRNYGLYTNDNLFSLNVNLAGAIMQVMENGGNDTLAAGDVVVFSGVNDTVAAIDGPIAQVRKASVAQSTAVAGVVFGKFNTDVLNLDPESPDDSAQGRPSFMEATPTGSAAPGEFVLVVVQGPTLVRASVLGSDTIQPGDLLSTSGTAGFAGKATTVNLDGVQTVAPGTVFGKALEAPQVGRDEIYVYVTLQ